MKIRRKLMLLGVILALGSTVTFAENASNILQKNSTLFNDIVAEAGLDEADAVEITTIEVGTIAPLQGFGIYNYRKDLSDKKYIQIITTGDDADGIRTNVGSKLTLGDNVEIKVTGSGSDGINLGEDSDGAVLISGNNMSVTAESGMGIRVNNSVTGSTTNQLQVGNKLTVVTNGAGSNSVDGVGYGVYAGLRSLKQGSQKSDSRIIIGESSAITTNGGSAHGVFANRSGKIVLGSNTNITVTGNSTSALRVEGTRINQGNTTITLLGNTKLTANNGTGQYAIYASGVNGNLGIVSNVKTDSTLDDFGNKDLSGNDLKISNQRVFNVKGDFRAQSSGFVHLDMTDGTHITGKTEIVGTGEIDFKIAGASSVWRMTGKSTLTNLTLADEATVYLGGVDDNAITSQILTVNGNYIGQNGRLIFSGALNEDPNSPIDQVVIKGNASGTTKVGVNNIGGLGEKTVNGIKIITVEGNNTNGKNTFVNDGRIVSGAYDYFVTKGNEQGGDTNNWYLTNRLSSEVGSPGPSIVRPEGGAYLGNALGANNLFQHSLNDRANMTGAVSRDSLELDHLKGHVWARVDKRKIFVKEKSGQIELHQDYDVVQVGVDLIRKQKDNRTYLFGVMGGYGDVQTNSRGLLSKAEGRIHGYSVGVYGTFYDEHPDKSGKYIDSWILWNTFDGQVSGAGLATEKYDLDGWTASIEAGYDQLLRKGKSSFNQNIWLKWQGQITYQGVRADGYRESNGTYVGKNDTNLQTRVGMRFYKKMKSDKGFWSQPFAELNWYHNTSTYDVSMDGDRDFSTRGARNVAELKIGYEGQVSKNLQLWGHIFGATGTHSHYSYGVRLGAKYTF